MSGVRGACRLGVMMAAMTVMAAAPSDRLQVRFHDGLVDVHATAVEVREVLDALVRATGMRVVYEDGRAARARVSAQIESRTPADAVLLLFEGLGVNYALGLDETGRQVRTLIVSGGGGGAGAVPGGHAPEVARTPVEPPPGGNPENEALQSDAGTSIVEPDEPMPQPPPGPPAFQPPVSRPGPLAVPGAQGGLPSGVDNPTLPYYPSNPPPPEQE